MLQPALSKLHWLMIGGAVAIVLVLVQFVGQPRVDFNTQIKPILNKHCTTCHGGVKREGGFSLLFRDEALAPAESGKPAIVPGKPAQSEMIRRLSLHDPEERMPYKKAPLDKGDIALLRRWIKQGAPWGDHWAYVPLQPVQVPIGRRRWWGLLPPRHNAWAKNEVDYFISEKHQKEDLEPTGEASKPVLLRRLALDLTGMPASNALAEQFLRDSSAQAYEKLVDSLLANPHFGERWAAMWLDLARYADTKGYERDDSRQIWRYRDWLIQAFNSDKPYDRFLTEQIAGDLLPDATTDNYLATAFHRNTMTNDEGGAENEEFRVAAVIDRVNTTWEALMGTTFGCVQCHNHPYDPFVHEDYYRFMAFFNNDRDEDTHAEYPLLREYQGEDSLRFIELQQWFRRHIPARAKELTLFLSTLQPTINSLTADRFVNSELADTKWLVLRKNGSARLAKVSLSGIDRLIFPYGTALAGGRLSFHLDSLQGPLLATFKVPLDAPHKFADLRLPAVEGKHDIFLYYENPGLTNFTDNGISFDWFYFSKNWEEDRLPGIQKAKTDFWALLSQSRPRQTPVMIQNPAEMYRPTFVFERGNWLVKGKEVQAGVPASLQGLPNQAPANRMGLALWLTDKKNPLTARTYINRIWEQLMGQGLVETLEDLGTQGAQPTHRELLDWLAWQWINDYQWSTKKLLKTIVMSATYRQDSRVRPELQEKDPYNKLYARGPRVRLSAEQVRDQALAVCGLLSEKMYGPSVFPYQPEGIWSSPWNGASWQQSKNEDQYRRSLYTYWKRSSPYPAMISFDGVNREVCVSRRIRTNTPLQALVTLNDSTYMAAAQAMAQYMSKENSLARQIEKGYYIAMRQPISDAKRTVLETLYHKALKKMKEKTTVAPASGILPSQEPEMAALTVVANAILNLDEVLNKG